MSQPIPCTSSRRDTPTRRALELCPVEEWLHFLGHRWNALVLWHLTADAKRHGELMHLLAGITPKVLSERLNGLMERGLVVRTRIDGFPPTVVYALTPLGEEAVTVLDGFERLAGFASAYSGRMGAA